MSYILDALKKSEEERTLGEAPKITSARAAVPADKKRSLLSWFIAVLLIINGVILAIFLTSKGVDDQTSMNEDWDRSLAQQNRPAVREQLETRSVPESAASKESGSMPMLRQAATDTDTAEQGRTTPSIAAAEAERVSEGDTREQESIADLIGKRAGTTASGGESADQSSPIERIPDGKAVDSMEPVEDKIAYPELEGLQTDSPVVAELIREELAEREKRRLQAQTGSTPPIPAETSEKVREDEDVLENASPEADSSVENLPVAKPGKLLSISPLAVDGQKESPEPVMDTSNTANSTPEAPANESVSSAAADPGTERAALPKIAASAPARTETVDSIPEQSNHEPAADQPPLLEQMPADFRAKVPDLPINVYVYAEQPERRFILVNMRKYREGSFIDGDLKLESIGHQSLIMAFKGERFRISRP